MLCLRPHLRWIYDFLRKGTKKDYETGQVSCVVGYTTTLSKKLELQKGEKNKNS